MRTEWGYSIEGDSLGRILSVDEFNAMTANKYGSDPRVESMIQAAQAAVRNYCGWHVSPAVSCIFETRMFDKRIIRTGRDLLIQLPARFVQSISKIKINNVEYSDYSEESGLVTVFEVQTCDRKSIIKVEYIGGGNFEAVKDIVMHRVNHALANSNGIQSETTGAESVTYNANWINNARATGLANDNKEVLNPYRLQGVF